MARLVAHLVSFLALLLMPVALVTAQEVRSVDPNAAMKAKAATASAADPSLMTPAEQAPQAVQPGMGPIDSPSVTNAASGPTGTAPTYKKDDLIGAAEGVFGKGAKGLAEMVEKVLKDQGEPNAYIAGREASGAFVVGARYGSGTMRHSVEGEKPVYWTGPSIGFDVGGDAAKVFVLVYNLYDGEDLYRRYPQVEGRAYFVGGLSGSYLRRGSVVLIPIRLGAGVRLGANIGYMKFSRKSKWLPF